MPRIRELAIVFALLAVQVFNSLATASAGWFAAEEDENCDGACQDQGLLCLETELAAHNGDVDTAAELKHLISQLGETTTSGSCTWEYGTSPAVPVFRNETCAVSASDRDISTFDCAKHPSNPGEGKRRLCYCVQATTAPTQAPTAPTTSTTAPTTSATAPTSEPTTPTPQPAAPTPAPTAPSPQPTATTPIPTAPTLEPTEATTSPTAPTSEPTTPTPQPTAPTQAPTAPTPEPTAPTSAPTAPTQEPTAPTTSPTAPTSAPTTPTPQPTAPTPVPTAPIQEPTAPTTSPTVPTSTPTTPTPQPTAPTSAPTAPTPEPTAPTTSPTAPTSEPTTPTSQPTAPTSAPTAPTQEPTEPTTAPTAPTSEPTTATSQPTAPTPGPTAPTPEPTAPTTSPTVPTSEPTAPTSQPTAPTSAPTAPTLEPTAPTTSPTAPTSEPTTPTPQPTAPTSAPTAPSQEPTAPTASPTLASTPTSPSPQPTAATQAPTAPTQEPTASTTAPTAPTSEPTTPTPEPTAPTSAPTAPTQEPTAPTTSATAPTSQPTAPSSQPTAPIPSSTAPTQEPTAPTMSPTLPTSEPTVPTPQTNATTTAPTAPTQEPTAPTTSPTAPTSEPTTPTSQPTAPTSASTAPIQEPTVPTTSPTAPTWAPTEALVELDVRERVRAAIAARVDAAIADAEEAELDLLSDLQMAWDNGTSPQVVVEVPSGIAAAQSLSKSQAVGDTVAMDVEDAGVQIDFPVATLEGLPPDSAAIVTVFDADKLTALSEKVDDSGSSSAKIELLAAMVLNIRRSSDSARLRISGLETPISFSIPLQPSNETQPPQCAFFNESTREWSTEGVTTLKIEDGKLYCQTTHLSLFGGVVNTFEKILTAALQCNSADDVLSEAGIRNLMNLDRWLWRPASLWLLVMVSMYCILIPWSFRRERLAREHFHWSDDRWCIEVEEEDHIHHSVAHSFFVKLADEIGLYEVLEARSSEENTKRETWIRKLWIIASCKVAIMYVRSFVGLETMCTRICVREFTRTMTTATHHHRRFNVRQEEHREFTIALQRADESLQRSRFRLIRAVYAMFASSHPWMKVMMFDIRVSAPIRALALATSVSASFMISAVYFGQGARSPDSPPECIMQTWQEKLLWNCWVGVVSLWVALVPKIALQVSAQRRCVRVLKGDTATFMKIKRKWRLKEYIIWPVFSMYNLYNISYCFLFISGVSEADASDWFMSGLASTTKSLIVAPLVGSVVSSMLAGGFATLKARRARRASRKAVGLHHMMERYALVVQKQWRGRIARRNTSELRQSSSDLGVCPASSQGITARLREIGANALNVVGRSFGMSDFVRKLSSRSRGANSNGSVVHKASTKKDDAGYSAADFVVHKESSGNVERRAECSDGESIHDVFDCPDTLAAAPSPDRFAMPMEPLTPGVEGDTGATAFEPFEYVLALPNDTDKDQQDSTGGATDDVNPSECSPPSKAAELERSDKENFLLIVDNDAGLQSEAIPASPLPLPGDKLCVFMSSCPAAGVEEFEEQSPCIRPLAMRLDSLQKGCRPDAVDPAVPSTAVTPCMSTEDYPAVASNNREHEDYSLEVMPETVSEDMLREVQEAQQRLQDLKKYLDAVLKELDFTLLMCKKQKVDPAMTMIQANMVHTVKKQCKAAGVQDIVKSAVLMGRKPTTEMDARTLYAQLLSETMKVEGCIQRSKDTFDYLMSCLEGPGSQV